MSGKNLTLQVLPLEILAHILKFVGNSSFYAFQNVNNHFFEILSSIVKSKVTSSEVLAKKKVEKYKKRLILQHYHNLKNKNVNKNLLNGLIST